MVVKVVRIDVAGWRLGQALLPLCLIATIGSRYLPQPAGWIVAGAFQLAALATFLRARRALGRHDLRCEAGAVQLGEHGPRIGASTVGSWTFHGGVARLYAGRLSWTLSTTDTEGPALSAALSRSLGKPVLLSHRGSPRARQVALLVGFGGAAIAALAIALDQRALALLGVPCAIVGMATFGALSQRVSSSERPRRPG